MHMPAIKGELCLAPKVAEQLHRMLIAMRSVKQGTQSGKLRASAAPLPRVEPWKDIISKAFHPIPNILRDRCNRNYDNIMSRGEGGAGRDLKPEVFMLTCPKCKLSQNCARNKLFTTAAVSLTCKNCKSNTSSTQWHCPHGLKWHTCKLHREPGMRSGKPRSQGTLSSRPNPLKAANRVIHKANKLGPLGSCRVGSLTSNNAGKQQVDTNRDHSASSTLNVQPCTLNSTRSQGKFKSKEKD